MFFEALCAQEIQPCGKPMPRHFAGTQLAKKFVESKSNTGASVQIANNLDSENQSKLETKRKRRFKNNVIGEKKQKVKEQTKKSEVPNKEQAKEKNDMCDNDDDDTPILHGKKLKTKVFQRSKHETKSSDNNPQTQQTLGDEHELLEVVSDDDENEPHRPHFRLFRRVHEWKFVCTPQTLGEDNYEPTSLHHLMTCYLFTNKTKYSRIGYGTHRECEEVLLFFSRFLFIFPR